MAYDISFKTVAARTLAASRRRVRIGEVVQAFQPALDEVWAFLRANPALKPGHNVFLYEHPTRGDDPMNVDFGVEVDGAFADAGPVRAVFTPAGQVVSVLHVGPYSGIPAAHHAIHAWREANNRQFAGWSWEIYGDWNEDERKLETEIQYLLA
jgi:effector-binding domain-containing protein